MGFTELDLSTAVFPGGFGEFDGTAIVSASPGQWPDYVFPGLALDPAKFYQFQFDFDPGDRQPSVYMTPMPPSESGPTWNQMGFADGNGLGAQRVTVVVGPGIDAWDTDVVALGYNHVLFENERDTRMTGARYRTGTITAEWSDWYDDAELSWLRRDDLDPEPSNDIHQQDSYDIILSDDYPPGDINECWSGTGHVLIPPSVELVNGNGSNADMFLGPNGGNLYIWEQRWWTKARAAAERTASSSSIPPTWDDNPPGVVDWEPTDVPVEHRLKIRATSTYADTYRVKGFVVSGPAGWNPGAFLDRTTVAAQADLAVTALTGDGLPSTFYADSAALTAIGYPFTGVAYLVIGIIDQPTQTGSWDGNLRTATVTTVDQETGYRPRYRVRSFIPTADAPAPCRLYPRARGGLASGRLWPPDRVTR